jgi:hypothetical protein
MEIADINAVIPIIEIKSQPRADAPTNSSNTEAKFHLNRSTKRGVKLFIE